MSEQPTARSPTPRVKMANDLTEANDIFVLVSRGTGSSSGQWYYSYLPHWLLWLDTITTDVAVWREGE